MKFFLSAELTFSRNVEELDMEKILEGIDTILEKGAPKGRGAKIKSWKLNRDLLSIEIESERWVRPHDAIFRLKNFFAEQLGKKHKLGVKKIFAKRYDIEFEVSKEPKESIRIPFVKEIKFQEKLCRIKLENLDEEFLQKNYIDRILSLIEDKIDMQYYKGKEEYHEVIWQSEKKEHKFNKNPTNEMEKHGWIMHRGRGQWIFSPIATKIMRTFEDIVSKELLKPLGFNEVIIPKAVTWDVWQKSGHAKSIYPEIYYICPPKTRNREDWEHIIDFYKITGDVPVDEIKENIKPPIGGVCYAQCPPLWPYFQNKTIADESLPIKVFDHSGPSMRYESGGIHGIERVDEFHRLEIVWIGYHEQVKKIRDEIVECFRKIFNEILELEWRMSWVTPWFMAQEGLKGLAEEDKSKRDVGTIDFESFLPYSKEWLEFQNVSNNGEKYPKGFNVKSQSSEALYSGCSGVGLERWLATFIAQHGLEQDSWPEEFNRRIGNLPKEIKFL
ncbi:MAG: aminoacyl--tRNA ligase-related protein [Candidatus Altiarchaeota archaeon]